MKILGVDPGPEESAWVIYNDRDEKIMGMGIESNYLIRKMDFYSQLDKWVDITVIEMIASYGMAVGEEVFNTCVWIGRFMEIFHNIDPILVYRKDVKMHLCNSMRAKDTNIRQALIDRFGGTIKKAKGKKNSPGPLYGIHDDIWSALAVAITYAEGGAK